MDLGLKDKVALITGGTNGIGLATARLLYGEGARVVVCGRDTGRLDTVAAEFGSDRFAALPGDVTDPAALQRLHDEATARFGGLDILVNNVGGSSRGPALDISDEAWETDLSLKLMAHVRMARIAVPGMRSRGGGAIVSVLGIVGKHPSAQSTPTSVSRAAGLAYAKALSRDLAPDNIRVNCVCVGVIKSEQHDRRWRGQQDQLSRDEFYDRLAATRGVPMGRTGEAGEAAAAIAFLVSGAASYITGAALNVDGGSSHVS
ncbi:MAG TPA: SDR family oxidoreductase [Streptosporangiaceae bacterium]